jgi:hypothetical protein
VAGVAYLLQLILIPDCVGPVATAFDVVEVVFTVLLLLDVVLAAVLEPAAAEISMQ